MQLARTFFWGWLLVMYTSLTLAASVSHEKESSEKKDDRSITVFQFGNPLHQDVLNQPAKPVSKLPDPDVDRLIEDMMEVLKRKVGSVGVSANQVGHPLQISITGNPMAMDSSGPYTVYINPVITKASKEISCFWHGCLSAEGDKFGKVATWQTVTVTALDAQGKKFTRELGSADAIVFQHEFRHLLGGGYHEHASDFKTEGELMKLALEGKLKFIEPCQSGEQPLLNDYIVGESIENYSQRIERQKNAKKKEPRDNKKQNDSTESMTE